MNIKQLIASASLLLIAGAALADDGKTRAEVLAELQQARAAGQLDQSEAALGRLDTQPSGLSRADVKAEVLRARAAGLLERNEATESIAYQAPRAGRASVDASLQATAAAKQQQR
ncbi:DUF4148 domain-containing protein [Rugamonas sp. CCM 8940]|uniref:DUF4148 domain-containing protein n=1 Tax=Rugamonas sp. CCM 8940 TaxID=2765359 RepID=UPI0018F42247|nr:DUF4148 domain-containing protein [Rugamonas sp. CCM 8940]MBJ7309744.1 DUF4148 domain-containing protein [Rugamonas sp. CCM 8940]